MGSKKAEASFEPAGTAVSWEVAGWFLLRRRERLWETGGGAVAVL